MDVNRVIAGTDGSDHSLRAVEWAAREAALHGAPLRIVSVPALPPRMSWQQPEPGRPDTVADVVRESYEQALAAGTSRAAEAAPGLAIDTALLPGSPDAALTAAAGAAAILVIGSRGNGGFSALILGSVSRYVATEAPGPVVVAREDTMAVHHEVVVGIGGDDRPAAVGFAFAEARLRQARLRAVHAWHWSLPHLRPAADTRKASAEAAGWLASLLAPWRQKYPGVEVIEDVVHAPPGRALAGASARADLVVLGRNGTAGDGRPRARAVTHALLHHAHGPVAVVPG